MFVKIKLKRFPLELRLVMIKTPARSSWTAVFEAFSAKYALNPGGLSNRRFVKLNTILFLDLTEYLKCLNFYMTDECVSDHNERINLIQIDKNFITQTFQMYNFIIRRKVRNESSSYESSSFFIISRTVFVDLYWSNPLIVIWDELVGQKFKHFQ